MRLLLLTILLFILGRSNAQESVVLVSDTLYSPTVGTFNLSDSDGWVYKPGNVENAAKPNLDTKGWIKFKPSQLTAKNFDQNGRFEGWFRIKIRLKATPNFKSPGLANMTWSAADVFANGKKIAAFGSTGRDKATFEENKFNRKPVIRTNLQPDSTYVIAFHVVDYSDPFVFGTGLRSGDNNKDILMLTSKKSDDDLFEYWLDRTFYDGLFSAVSTTLALLFWILFGLNKNEKNIKRFAIGCSLVAIMSVAGAISTAGGQAYVPNALFGILTVSAAVSYVFYIPVILAGVFNRKFARPLRILMTVTYIILLLGSVLQFGWLLLLAIFPLIVALYYLVTSWKTVKGAQWAIVTGFLLSFIFLIFFVARYNILGNSDSDMLLVLIYTVSPPLGMLIYVSSRFGEMISEVRVNADKVLRLSEEKREQALNQQKILEAEVEKQTAELRTTVNNLKSTQSQLIQSEKMASLGELTAGIAHEIQNPLNFVNNFSEVSIELFDEMGEELEKGDIEEVKAISIDIKQNLEKIAHHGRRADGIVKGMLQHSRPSSAQKEPTDINALVDEYLRLAYHGLRAKNKSFNAELITHFDENLPKANVFAQDIGRVVLNLFTNAFYAVQKRAETSGEDYKPVVEVLTRTRENSVEIFVKDNGIGIPDAVKDKIIQPFFTTKPTGEGTGLGLSLSYDIVVKSHGGQIEIESQENEFTLFSVLLPIA